MEVYVRMDDNFENIIAYATEEVNGTYIKAIQEDPVIDISKLFGYKLQVDGSVQKLVFDEEKYSKIVSEQSKEESIKSANVMMDKLVRDNILNTATDTEAYAMRYLYSEWSGKSVDYKKDNRLMYNDKFYKVLQDHTSQEDWTPDTASSLYVEISEPNVEYPEFKQQTRSHDVYMAGDKITYNGEKYVSKIDNNTWSPTEYPAGWEKVTEEGE